MAVDFSKYGKPVENIEPTSTSGTDFSKYGKVPTLQTENQSIAQQREARVSQGLPVAANKNRVEPTTGGTIARGLIKAPLKAGLSVPAAFAGEKGITIKSKYLGDTSDLAKTIAQNADKLAEKVNKGDITLERAIAGTIADAALNTADVASLVPGVGMLRSAGTNTLKALASQTAQQGLKQTVIQGAKSYGRGAALGALYDTGSQLASGEEFNPKQTLKSAALGGALDIGLTKGVPGAINVAKKVPNLINSIVPKSEGILQRLSRTTPTAQAKFEQMAGESQGKYLERRGIFGNKESIIKQLNDRFNLSKGEADSALSNLPGNHKAEPVQTTLDELFDREKRVSAPGALSPDLQRVGALKNKHESVGLTMSEINEVKRLYERNVKLDFLKQNLPEGIARANNIDNAVRKWQFSTAEKLGLKNLPQINKETQLAKQLMDAMGKANAGKAGNDAINLSDWLLLSGGNPTALSLYLTKKIFSNEKLQGRIAKLLSRTPKLGDVKAQFGGSQGLPALIPGRDYSLQKPNNPKFKPIALPKSVRETNLGLNEVTGSKRLSPLPPKLESKKAYKKTVARPNADVYEPYTPESELPTIPLGSKPKTKNDLPTINFDGKIGQGALLGGAGLTGLGAALNSRSKISTERTKEQQNKFDRKSFTDKIVGIENEALKANGGDLYKSIGVSGDLGKYQVNPKVLKDWANAWLNKEYTPQQFINDPDAQERFFNQFLDVVERLKLTPEEAAVAWHRGWGKLGEGKKGSERDAAFKEALQKEMQSGPGRTYLAKFNK